MRRTFFPTPFRDAGLPVAPRFALVVPISIPPPLLSQHVSLTTRCPPWVLTRQFTSRALVLVNPLLWVEIPPPPVTKHTSEVWHGGGGSTGEACRSQGIARRFNNEAAITRTTSGSAEQGSAFTPAAARQCEKKHAGSSCRWGAWHVAYGPCGLQCYRLLSVNCLAVSSLMIWEVSRLCRGVFRNSKPENAKGYCERLCLRVVRSHAAWPGGMCGT